VTTNSRSLVGVDAVAISRFRRVLARRPLLAKRLFTKAELEHAAAKRDGIPSLAARFAAKEATMKVIGQGIGRLAFKDIEVIAATQNQGPALQLHGRAAEVAQAAGIDSSSLSLTHSDDLAFAVVVSTKS